MPSRNKIDNESSLADHLQRNLPGTDKFSIVLAYFTIYGYELLEEDYPWAQVSEG